MSALFVFVFLVIFGAILIAATFGLKFLETQRKNQVTRMLGRVDGAPSAPEPSILLDALKNGSAAQLAERFAAFSDLDNKIQQSALGWTLDRALITMAVAGLVGALLSLKVRVLIDPVLSMIALTVGFAVVPYLYIVRKRAARLKEFEEQFPEALDFFARSMRAGHAFLISMEMVIEEADEPLASEFRRVHNEHQFGAPLEIALSNLAERVPLLDVRFFVSAVLMQRETGGNLAEILNKLAYVIRERFRLKGQVRAASAHGRITGLILTLLPIALSLGLMVVAPDYLKSMARDPDGVKLIIFATLAQFVGYMTIRKIINFKV